MYGKLHFSQKKKKSKNIRISLNMHKTSGKIHKAENQLSLIFFKDVPVLITHPSQAKGKPKTKETLKAEL